MFSETEGGSGSVPVLMGEISKHPIVPIIGIRGYPMQKECRYCQRYKIKSKSGNRLRTNFKCATCNIALCCVQHTGRNCGSYELFLPGNLERSHFNICSPVPIGDMSKHPMIPIIGIKRMQKDCKYCQVHKIKSKSGLRFKTNFKCATCDIALCSAQHTERHYFLPFQQDSGNNPLGPYYYSDNKGRDYFVSMSNRNTMANRKCNIEGHPVVPIGENNMQRDCKYCQKYRVKTKRGWNVKTKFKCETCNVNLCSGDMTSRNCFVLYHEENVFGKAQPEMYISPLDTNM
ncbi:unnamed protein product [Mytilus coruscus]|uniref:PiggyBac transposable element-derived protein 4 C-terminal zinc-ribbon domain-containing protein n=1 Tax=Mytilus coruscus TaxID=42192 RepID=A0A6J8DNJ6_MYTCO|nr:unnamed protein product [Mytilus coruscus]